jgi:CRP/FNR family transcriptional regulator, cyclic AMP receptor protein
VQQTREDDERGSRKIDAEDAQGVSRDDRLPAHLAVSLRSRANQIAVRAGQLILSAGATSTESYFILSGKVHVTLFAPSGREVSIRDIGEGQLFGEMAAIDGGARSATVVAATPGRLAALPASMFRTMLAESPELSLWLIQRLVAQIRDLTERVFELSALPARGRLHCELLRVAATGEQLGEAIIIRPAPTHAAIAARIGSQREAVTREFSYLSDVGILKQERRQLTLLNLHRLVGELRRSNGERTSLVAASALLPRDYGAAVA